MNKLTPQLLSLFFLLAATTVNAQSTQQDINVTLRPSLTVEEKVANETKEKQLRKEADDKIAAEEARIGGVRGTRAGRSAVAFDRCDESSFFAADKGSRADADCAWRSACASARALLQAGASSAASGCPRVTFVYGALTCTRLTRRGPSTCSCSSLRS